MDFIKFALVLFIPFCLIYSNQASQTSDPCFSYNGKSNLTDCIVFISQIRKISFNETRNVVEEIIRLVKSADMSIDGPYETKEGYFLSEFAKNSYHFPNHFGGLEPCDEDFCQKNFVIKNSPLPDFYKLCKLFCSRPYTSSTVRIHSSNSSRTISSIIHMRTKSDEISTAKIFPSIKPSPITIPPIICPPLTPIKHSLIDNYNNHSLLTEPGAFAFGIIVGIVLLYSIQKKCFIRFHFS